MCSEDSLDRYEELLDKAAVVARSPQTDRSTARERGTAQQGPVRDERAESSGCVRMGPLQGNEERPRHVSVSGATVSGSRSPLNFTHEDRAQSRRVVLSLTSI